MNTRLAPSKRRLAATAVAGLAAFCVAAPAQASLGNGLTSGGCLAGIQVGHITHPNGDVVPICRILD